MKLQWNQKDWEKAEEQVNRLQLLALEPVAEATVDRISFGFGRYRSPKDAREYAFSVFSRKESPQ